MICSDWGGSSHGRLSRLSTPISPIMVLAFCRLHDFLAQMLQGEFLRSRALLSFHSNETSRRAVIQDGGSWRKRTTSSRPREATTP